MLRLVIFDFDGVLADSEPAHFAMFQKVLEQEGILINWSLYCEKYLGYDDIECLEHLLPDFGRKADSESIERIAEQKKLAFAEHIQQNHVLYPGGPELLAALAKREILCSICSGALREEVVTILEQGGLDHYFTTVVAAEDVAQGKPHPEGYRLALKQTNDKAATGRPISPGECLVIEDSQWGLQAAKAAEMTCVALETSYPADQLSLADMVVPSVAELDIDEVINRFFK